MFATVSRGVGESDREKKNISTNNNPFIQIRYFHDLRSGGQFEVFNFIRILFSPWVYMCVCVCLRFWFYIFLICKMSERKKIRKNSHLISNGCNRNTVRKLDDALKARTRECVCAFALQFSPLCEFIDIKLKTKGERDGVLCFAFLKKKHTHTQYQINISQQSIWRVDLLWDNLLIDVWHITGKGELR